MFSREKNINEITEQLSWISTIIELRNSLNLNSISVHAESFFCGLLNIVFGYQLHNLNAKEMNYTSIDLGDEENNVAIQVTSEKTSTKIKETLRKFTEKEYYKKYGRLIVFIIGSKPNFTTTFENDGKIEFSKERDIWDIKYLINQINNKDDNELAAIAEYMNSQLVIAKGYTGTNPIPVVEATKQKAFGLCMAKLQSIGVTRELAEKIIVTDVASTKYQYILDNANAGINFLTGDYGTGKSHALAILAQRLADKFLNETWENVPLFAHAREVVNSGSIQKWIDNLEIGRYNYFLFIDGLDEIDFTVAKQLAEEIDTLTAINGNNRILAGSRQMSMLTEKTNKLVISPLSVEEQCVLYSVITGECEVRARFSHLDEQMQLMLSKPFFCIIYALFNAEPKSWAKTDMDLVTAFVDRVLKGVDESSNILYQDLSTLAAKSIDRNLAEIHISEIRLQGRLDLLLKTGFISQSGDYLSFSLPIIAQWMAAEAIRFKIIRVEDIVCDKTRTHRWLYALSILFSQMTFEESLDYFSLIVRTMPGVASRIIRDGLRFSQAKSLPSAYECGQKLQSCMKVWISALGPLSQYIAPVDATNPLPLIIGVEDNHITFSWTNKKMDSSVTTMSIRELARTQETWQARGVPAQSTWPWIITFEYLSDNLQKVIEGHAIITGTGQLKHEFFWNTALCIAGKGKVEKDRLSALSEDLEELAKIEVTDPTLKEEDVSLKDPTAYLLRRNFGTHLSILGFSDEEIAYLMGHKIGTVGLNRNMFSNEDQLRKMFTKLNMRPLFGSNACSQLKKKVSSKKPIARFDNVPEASITALATKGAKAAFRLSAKEPGDTVKVTIKKRPNTDAIPVTMWCYDKRLEEMETCDSTVNVMRMYQETYRKARGDKKLFDEF